MQFEERWLNMLAVLLEASNLFAHTSEEGHTSSNDRLARVAEVFAQENQNALAQNRTQLDRLSFLSSHQGGLVLNSEGVVPLNKNSGRSNGSDLEVAMDSLLGGGLTTLALTLTLPAAYGGVHLAAWSWIFPTAVESLLWKVSSLIIAGMTPAIRIAFATGPVLSFVVRNTSSCIQRLRKRETNGNERRKISSWELPEPIINIVEASSVLLMISCVVARLYIVVESFISLRLVPVGVYWTPFWLETIPHV